MKRYCSIVITLILLLMVTSCVTQQESGYNFKEISDFAGNKILLLEPLFLNEILGVTAEKDITEKNLFIGNIEFSGGVVTNPEKGMMVQTKQIVFDRQESYRDQALHSLTKQVRRAAQQLEYNELFWGREDLQENIEIFPNEYGKISFTLDYREHKEDGKDNINLPWYQFSVDSLSPAMSSLLNESAGAPYLMVPVIEHYYSHSAGWFNDQWAGCGAGFRITYHILVFDLLNGKKVFHFSDTEKYLEEFSSRISRFLLMQQLAITEESIYKALIKNIPKG